MTTTAIKTNKKTYRTLLLKKREELLASTKAEPDVLSANIRTPDEVEFAAKTADQDVAAVTADIRARMLREVEKSLVRLANGTYGVCESCGGEISPNRLKAVPWAQYCLICQELRSRN
jgi:RNA polymerase-binding transcription factor